MKRSRLKNKANKGKDPTDIRNYKKQRQYVVNTFNDHFGCIVDNLGLDHWDDHSLSPTKGSDRIDNIIKW